MRGLTSMHKITENNILSECKRCHQSYFVLSDKGFCEECITNLLNQMRCLECDHRWLAPGLPVNCPICKSINLTSDDRIIDQWRWNIEAKKADVHFLGIQKGINDVFPDMPLFLDPQTNGSFTPGKYETISKALERKRREFLLTSK